MNHPLFKGDDFWDRQDTARIKRKRNNVELTNAIPNLMVDNTQSDDQ